jgi:hypothetical protein
MSCGVPDRRAQADCVSQFDLAKVCGQDSQGNKVCADSKSVTIFSSGRCSKNSHVEPPCIESYKRNVDVRLLKVCGQDSKGNKVCAEKREVEIDARLLKVCGKDAKGNVVCAEKRQELDARSILVSALLLRLLAFCLCCLIALEGLRERL